MENIKRVNILESEWEDIEHSYRLSPYNAPINRLEERQKLYAAYDAGESYNPQFEYQELPECPVARLRAFMAQLNPEQSALEELYYEKATLALLAIRYVQTHSPSVITGATCLAYGLPSCQLLAEAKTILAKTTPDVTSTANLPAEQAAVWMQTVLERVGIQGWNVIVFVPMNAMMSIDRLDKQMRIRQGTVFSQESLTRLLVHELGVHILRYENGAVQPIRLFRDGFTGFLDTEEGLAVYSEERAGVLETETLRKYAGRVIAAHLALSQSFFDVFQTLVSPLGQEMAFEITVRAKRGFIDTSQPGAHTKDIVYLKGYLQVKEHLERHPEDYELLFTGKVGLQHLSLVKSLMNEGLVDPPTFLPNQLIEMCQDVF